MPTTLPSIESEEARWLAYVEGSSARPDTLWTGRADAVKAIWARVCAATGRRVMPPITHTLHGKIGLVWNLDHLYLDVELGRDGRVEWFWSDRATGAYGGSGDESVAVLPPEFDKIAAGLVPPPRGR